MDRGGRGAPGGLSMQLGARVSGSRGSTLWWSHPGLRGCDKRTNAPAPLAATMGGGGASVCMCVVCVCKTNAATSGMVPGWCWMVADLFFFLHPLVAAVHHIVHMLSSPGIDKLRPGGS